MGCSTDTGGAPPAESAPSTRAPTGRVSSPIYGDDTQRDNDGGGDTFFEDTVVYLDSGCSGTLITPTLVLASAHCPDPTLVLIGPHRADDPATPGNTWRAIYPVQSTVRMGTGADTQDDLLLVTLSKPVLTHAYSARPFYWTNWLVGPAQTFTWNDSSAQFGIAGWSPYSGPKICHLDDPPEDGPTDDEHTYWRQFAEPMNENAFVSYSSIIQMDPDNHNKFTSGDSGGPLYTILPSGVRRVIGVASRTECALQLDLSFKRYNYYTDVTHGATHDWIASQADDTANRTYDWLDRHGRLGAPYWKGEVDYLGPCTTPNGYELPSTNTPPAWNQDLDCDHWYDVHDNCPRDYNPGQEEDANGKGLACAGRAKLDWNPNDPQPAHLEIPLGGPCRTDSPECPIGVCGFVEVAGQLWESNGAPPYPDPAYQGSYVRIDTSSVEYKLIADITPNLAGSEWYYPPEAEAKCIPLTSIASIPNPSLCTISTNSIESGPYTETINLHPGSDSFNLMSGLIGNIGLPDSTTADATILRVTNGSAATVLTQTRTIGTRRRHFIGESLSIACPGWTHKFAGAAASMRVSASSSPATRVLVEGADAAHAECFLTGFNGPWGEYSVVAAQPTARIYRDPLTNDILMTVTPSGISGNSQRVEAYATCIDLSP